MPVGPGKYRVVQRGGKKIRIHLTPSGTVNEAKNIESGATHSPKQFQQDRRKRKGR